MNSCHYKLDRSILKANDAATLWKTENGIVEIGKDTLAIPIKLEDKTKGFVLHGKCKFILDTIVETNRGAVGKPVEKEINEPFLMLGGIEQAEKNLNPASNSDLDHMNYESEEIFITRAEELCDEFFARKTCSDFHLHNGSSVIFAFPNKPFRMDMLIADNEKIVYKARNRVFISNRDKVILKTPEETAIAHHGKSLILRTRTCC